MIQELDYWLLAIIFLTIVVQVSMRLFYQIHPAEVAGNLTTFIDFYSLRLSWQLLSWD